MDAHAPHFLRVKRKQKRAFLFSFSSKIRARIRVQSSLAEVAQLVEHRPEEAGVTSSNLVLGTKYKEHNRHAVLFVEELNF